MTEAQWLVSEDPQAMLAFLMNAKGKWVDSWRPPSDRKLRLWACACVRAGWTHEKKVMIFVDRHEAHADGRLSLEGLEDAEEAAFPRRAWSVAQEAHARWLADELEYSGIPPAQQAALLREIAGNPWRPVTLPWLDGGEARFTLVGSASMSTQTVTARIPYCPWLTPTVLSLAQAGYLEQSGRRCGRCLGVGRIDNNPIGGPEPNPHIRHIIDPPSVWDCPDCHGTGRIEDGALDPARLAILADALEEAGCDEEDVLWHLRGWERTHAKTYIKSTAHPLLHVRGCHVLDALLGKE